ncbi:hypothetical protein [Streptomyces agglomeratus]|uniref:hypothetical protein n=1 Tax=Streptomyces agglomeratus TaxID=285458 RepID=UPI00114D2AF4|nr:hypothetical protein [Streptomyces agglomeratus]
MPVLVSAADVLPGNLGVTDLVTMASQAATATGVLLAYWYFKRTGPVLDLQSGTDSHLIYIRMTNTGRQSLTVRAYGIGTLRASRKKAAEVYPAQACPGELDPHLWVELEKPLEVPAGMEEVVVLEWPTSTPVCAVLESTDPAGKVFRQATGPSDENLVAAVRTFAGWKACRITPEAAGTRYALKPTHKKPKIE